MSFSEFIALVDEGHEIEFFNNLTDMYLEIDTEVNTLIDNEVNDEA